MTLIQGRGISVGMSHLNLRLEVPSDVQGSRASINEHDEDLSTVNESLPPLITNAMTISSAMLQISESASPTCEDMDGSSCCSPASHHSAEPIEALEPGQTRNRSGTTVHSPPFGAGASLATKSSGKPERPGLRFL